jgi:hypothetical protein
MFVNPEAAERLATICQAGRSCARLACFQARVEASTGARPVYRHVDACAGHITEAVLDLKAWARDHSVVRGWLKVLAIDPYAAAHYAASGPGTAALNFAFYSVPVGQQATAAALAGAGQQGQCR